MTTCPRCGLECAEDGSCLACAGTPMTKASFCPSCGSNVGPDGKCQVCGQDKLLELEIGAFMEPAIKRARLWLIILGAVYVAAGAFDYFRIADARDKIEERRRLLFDTLRAREIERSAAPRTLDEAFSREIEKAVDDLMQNTDLREFDPRFQVDRAAREAEELATIAAWLFAISVLVGAVQLRLAAWAKENPKAAFNVALVVFGAHTLLMLLLAGPAVLLSEVRLVFLGVLITGFVAGRKAERLRREHSASVMAMWS